MKILKLLACGCLVLVTQTTVAQELSRTDSANLSHQKSGTIQRVNNTNTSPTKEFVVPVINPKPVVAKAIQSVMSKGENPGLQVDIPEVMPEDLQRAFEDAIRNKTKSKLIKVGEELSVQETIIEDISDFPMNVYAMIVKLDSGTRIISFFEDKGEFISEPSSPDKFTRAREFLIRFGVKEYTQEVNGQVKAEQRKLDDVESDLKKLIRQNEKIHLSIKENESDIVNAELDIKANLKEQPMKDDEIIKQKSYINSIKDKEQKKDAEKDLKDLKRQKERLREDNVSFNKKIVEARANIEELETQLSQNQQEQKLMHEQVDAQRAWMKAMENKLAKIN